MTDDRFDDVQPDDSTPPSIQEAPQDFAAEDFEADMEATQALVPAHVPADVERSFEDWTWAELLNQLIRAPRQTWAALWAISAPPDLWAEPRSALPRLDLGRRPAPDLSVDKAVSGAPSWQRPRDWLGDERLAQLGLYLTAFLLAFLGCSLLVANAPERRESIDLAGGAPYMLMALLAWGLAELVGSWRSLRAAWQDGGASQRALWLARLLPLVFILMGVWRLMDASDEPLRSADDVQLILSLTSDGLLWIALGLVIWWTLSSVAWGLQRRKRAMRQRAILEEARAEMSEGLAFGNDDEGLSQPLAPSSLEADLPWYMRIHPTRVFLVIGALILVGLTWVGTSGNTFSTPTFYIWLGSIACAMAAFAPQSWRPRLAEWRRAWAERERWRVSRGVLLAFTLILLLGGIFRFTNLNGNPADGTAHPPEMTSDHVEKLLDAARVRDGARNIFFANNGGREPIHMYVLAVFSSLPGLGINHETLKLLAVIESMLSLPIFFWLGLVVMGERDRRWGVLLGLLLAGLFAVSYWHVTVTRLALRIVMMPAVSALLLIFLVRAIRHQRRGDFILAGLVLGVGLYTYQAARMLPIVVIVGLALAFFSYRTARERIRLLGHGAVLVIVSAVVFVPLFHYSVENPEQFWRRTAGRLLGDDIITERLADGRIVERIATFEERVNAFTQNVPTLLNNLRNALLMFHWKGDVGWINGLPNYPALDPLTGALLLVGLVAWAAYALRQRDPALWLIPLGGLIMLLPSALSIAFPLENPSFTRTSGAMPMTLLLAALPLGLMVERLRSTAQRGHWAALALVGLILLGAYSANSRLYFVDYYNAYSISSLPYSDPGRVLRGFAESDGAYGNAFMIAFPFWWDHRAVGLAAGLEAVWPNGVYDYVGSDSLTRAVDYVPHFMRDAFARADRFRFNPDRDLLFFYARDDGETRQQLRAWFPQGREMAMQTYQRGDDYWVFRAPALGLQAFRAFIAQNIPSP
ncbi:MAG: glycosyltransferase family 39 protein [Anaerolineae bacterium]|nr:glycosyltransferase family 39 protein [Anaerolineae bacterium]MDW8171499.1 glycosyltransferase family 39 protein [Anaerolineae bacterium]